MIPLNLFGRDTQAVQVPNPVPGPLNTSEYVESWTKSARQWQGMGFFTREMIDFKNYPNHSFKIWSPVAGKVMIKFFSDKGGESTKKEYTVAGPTKAGQWQVFTFDASQLPSGYYDKIEVMPVPESPEAIGPLYFDDFILYPDLKSMKAGTSPPSPPVPAVLSASPSAGASGEMLLNRDFANGLADWELEQSGTATG